MNRNSQILFSLIGILIFTSLSACTSLVSPIILTSSKAAEIADFELPDGYRHDFSTSFLGFSMIAYSRADGPSHIYLIQSEKDSNGEKLAEVMAEMVVGFGNPRTRMTIIETHKVLMCGQETTMVISDIINAEGIPYRQAIIAFEGNAGPALLVFSEPTKTWDQAKVDHLIESFN